METEGSEAEKRSELSSSRESTGSGFSQEENMVFIPKRVNKKEPNAMEDSGTQESDVKISFQEQLIAVPPKPLDSSGRSPRKISTKKRSRSLHKDELNGEYEGLIRSLLYVGKYPPESVFVPLLDYVEEKMKKQVCERKYKEAQYYQAAYTKLRKPPTKEEYEKADCSKLERAQQMMEQINQKYDQLLSQKNAEVHALMTQLDDKIAREEDEYEQLWQSPEHMALYSKPSRSLLDLRIIENKYAAAGMFRDAEITKSKADSLELKETMDARNKAVDDMISGYNSMKQKHQKLTNGLKEYQEREIRGLNIKRAKELKGWDMYMQRQDVQSPTVKTRETIVFTPRPVKFKISNGNCSLNLGTLNLKQYVRVKNDQRKPAPISSHTI